MRGGNCSEAATDIGDWLQSAALKMTLIQTVRGATPNKRLKLAAIANSLYL